MKIKTANLQHEKKLFLVLGSPIMKSDIFYNIIQECIIVSKIITDVIQAQWSVS